MSVIKPLHVVQIGSDDSIFERGAPSDTLKRQIWYGEILAKKHLGSHLTCLLLTKQNVKTLHIENVSLIPVKSVRFIKFFLVWFALLKLHHEQEIHVISPQDIDSIGWIVPIFCRLYTIPCVAQIHYDLFSPHLIRDHIGTGIFGWLRQKIVFFFLHKFSAVRVVGQAVKSEMLKRDLHSKVSVIPVAVTLLEGDRQINEHNNSILRVLFVGRLTQEKNLLLWLAVAKQIHDAKPAVKFDIVGNGEEFERLKKKANELDIESYIHFHGSVAYQNLADYYTSASVFLLTSHYEGFGRVLVEAYAYGLPCVAPNISGVQDIILNEKTGFLCEPENTSEMADRVLQLLDSATTRRFMGKAGEEYVSRVFDPQKLAEDWIDYLIQAIPNR